MNQGIIENCNDRWAWMKEELGHLRENDQYRNLVSTELLEEGWLLRDGKRMLNLASNDYLGLASGLMTIKDLSVNSLDSDHPANADDSRALSSGAGASRLVVGNDPLYSSFERKFAAFKGTESCLIFSSGYMANAGIIPALVGRHDVIFSDRLNHASIVDGIVLSRAEHIRYGHRDLGQLERRLKQVPSGKRKLIVTDTLFSMDGTIAPLRELVELKDKYGAILMVDEAHSGGIYGEYGQGLVHELGLQDRVEVQMGTFSKAYGGCGAYAAGDAVLIDYLVNKARTLIYNTALPPIVLHAVRANWQSAMREGWRRQGLLARSAWFRGELRAAGFDTGASESQIVPIIIGDNTLTVNFSRALQAEGIAAVAIRPPTVPSGTARIRFTLMATHSQADLQWAVSRIVDVGRRMGLIS